MSGLREGRIRIEYEERSGVGVVLWAAFGLGAGLLAGMALGSTVGQLDSDRVRRAMDRLRSSRGEALLGPSEIEATIRDALDQNPTTRELDIRVRATEEGLVELTGTAPDETARELAGDVARGTEAAETVVNRVLVEGHDVAASPPPSRSG